MDKTTAAMIKVVVVIIMVSLISVILLKTPILAEPTPPPPTGQYVSPYIDPDGTYHSFDTLAELQQYVMSTFPGQPIPIQINWS
jgi:hypothetical protein